MEWPVWWEWDLELTPHVYKRMDDREFSEVELRRMLEAASNFRPDVLEGRWIIETRFQRKPWEVIVEPDFSSERLAVITAYQIEL